MTGPGDSDLAAFRAELDTTLGRFKKLSTVHINAETHKEATRKIVQRWFRQERPGLLENGIAERDVLATDAVMQSLLRLASTRSLRSHYISALTGARRSANDLEVQLEIAYTSAHRQERQPRYSLLETRILETLEALVPSAAASYKQALKDLIDPDRVSFRGTANELRSVLWDVLDRLAPDEEVMAVAGYKHERDQTKPTQKQKTRFILKARKLAANAIRVPETTADMIEERVGTLTRATYNRSSISTHQESARSEVNVIKTYLDGLLSELLAIHV